MTFSRTHFFFFATVGLLAACSFRGNDAQKASVAGASTGSLDFDTVRVEDVRNSPADEYKFISERTYRLRTCLIDKLNLRRWGNEAVTVTGPELKFEKTTDANGCFEWTQKVGPYRALAREHYVEYRRDISLHSQTLSVRYAINPWLGREGFTDLTRSAADEFTPVPEARETDALLGVGSLADGAYLEPNLLARAPEINIDWVDFRAGAARFQWRGRFPLHARRTLYDGTEKETPQKNGRFRLTSTIKESRPDGKWTLLAKIESPTALELNELGELFFETTLSLPPHNPAFRRYAEFEISPEVHGTGMTAARSTLELETSGLNFTGKKLYATAALHGEAVAPTVTAEAPFLIEKRTVARDTLIGLDLKTWTKKVRVHAKVCPETNTLPPRPLTGGRFRVEIAPSPNFSPSALVRKPESLNADGCLEWNEDLEYPVKWPVVVDDKTAVEIPTYYVLVKSLDFPYPDSETVAKPFQLNFWETEFARDVEKKGKFPPYRGKKPAELTFGPASYQASGSRFEVNQYLELFRHFHFDITLGAQLYRDFWYEDLPFAAADRSVRNFEFSRNLRFKVLGILAGRDANPPHQIGKASEIPRSTIYLTHFTSEATVDPSGQLQLSALIPFLSDQAHRLKRHTKLYLKISEIAPDENGAANPPFERIFAANFYVPTRDNAAVKNLRVEQGPQTEADFSKLLADAKIAEGEARPIAFANRGIAYQRRTVWPALSPDDKTPASPLDLAIHLAYGKRAVVTRVSLDGSLPGPQWQRDLSGLKLDPKYLIPLVNGSVPIQDPRTVTTKVAPVLKYFCAQWAEPEIRRECVGNPTAFFELNRVEVLTAAPTLLPGARVDNNLEIRFFGLFSKPVSTALRIHDGQKAESVREHLVWSSSVGMDNIFGGKFAMGGKEETATFINREMLYNFDVRTDNGINLEKNAWAGQGVTLSLRAPRQQCLMLRPVGFERDRGAHLNYVFCQKSGGENFEETWYQFDEKLPSSEILLTNPENAGEQGYFKLIRGESTYREFKLRLMNQSVAYAHEPIPAILSGSPHPAMAEKISISDVPRLMATGGVGPGVLHRYAMRANSRWETRKLDNEISNCVLTRDPRDASTDPAQLIVLTNYCRCFHEAVAHRWTYAEYKRKKSNESQTDLSAELGRLNAYCKAEAL